MHPFLLSTVETANSAEPEGASPHPRSPGIRIGELSLFYSLRRSREQRARLRASWRSRIALLLDTAITFGLATGILAGVALAQAARDRPVKSDEGDRRLRHLRGQKGHSRLTLHPGTGTQK